MIRIITLALCLSFASMSFGVEFSCDDSDMPFCPLFVEGCRNTPDVSACIVLNSFKIIIAKEICESDVACQVKHAKAMVNFNSFVGENTGKPGMGNAAVNMCEPFHRYQPSSEIGKDYYNRLEEISPDLVVGGSNDYPALWACVEEKYQTLMMDLLKK